MVHLDKRVGALALCVASTLLLGFDASKVNLVDHRDHQGTRRVVEVDAETLGKLPDWSPSLGWPTLRLEDAVESSKERMREASSTVEEFSVHSIRIDHRRYASNERVAWYLVVEFYPVIDGNELISSGYWAVVLMDGTVLLPETVEASGG